MATDEFESNARSLTGPITSAAAVTPNDSTDLSLKTRAVYVGGSGDLAVVFEEGTAAVTLTGLSAGVWHPIRASRILVTGTTATNIVAGF